MNRFEVIVIGVGAMGSAACLELARRGVSVLGVESSDVPNGLGSSGGHIRIIRHAYFEDPAYIPLLTEAYRGWERLERETGRRVFERCGLLYCGRPEGPLLRGLSASPEHLPRALVRDEEDSKFKALVSPPGFERWYEADAGYLRCEDAVALQAESSLRAGAKIMTRTNVKRWTRNVRGYVVETDRGVFESSRLVLTAGAWTSRLLDGLGVNLRVTRQVTGWVWPKAPQRFEGPDAPCWVIEDDDPRGGILYGFPMAPGRVGMKVGRHVPFETVDPDTVDRNPAPADEATFREALKRILPDADGELLSMAVCLYTMSPDGNFIVDALPEGPHGAVACGFSGHGFKFAPAIGRILADLVLDGATELPIDFLSRRRFSP